MAEFKHRDEVKNWRSLIHISLHTVNQKKTWQYIFDYNFG